MLENIETVIIGGGQGGLSTSYYLSQRAGSTSSWMRPRLPPIPGGTIAGNRSPW